MSRTHDENGNFAVGNPGGPGRPEGSKDKRPRRKPSNSPALEVVPDGSTPIPPKLDRRTSVYREWQARVEELENSDAHFRGIRESLAFVELYLAKVRAQDQQGIPVDMKQLREVMDVYVKLQQRCDRHLARIEKQAEDEAIAGELSEAARQLAEAHDADPVLVEAIIAALRRLDAEAPTVGELIAHGHEMAREHPAILSELLKIRQKQSPRQEPLPVPEHQAASRPRQPVHEKPAQPAATDDTPAQEPPPDRSTGGHERGEFGFLSTPKAAWDDV